MLLNITPDHLDRHGDMAGYVAAKEHIFARQQPGDCAVIGIDDEPSRAVYDKMAARSGIAAVPVALERPVAGGVSFRAGMLVDADGYTVDFSDVPTLPGDHNAQNAACAWAACRCARRAARADRGRPRELSRPAAPPGARRVGRRRASSSTTARRPTPTPRPARCRAIATSTGSPAARRRRAAWRRSRRGSPRIRHAFLIGEATELFAGQLEGKLAYSRCGDLRVGARRGAPARRSARRTRRRGRAAVAGLRLVRPVDEFRASRRCVPRHGARPAGRAEFGEGSVIQVPRADRSVLGHWWWTVDRWSLGAVLAIMAFGVLLTLAASPPAAERIGADSFLFAKRQFVFLPIALMLMLAISLASPRHVRRLALIVFCGSVLLLAATFVIGVEIKGARRWISVPGLSSVQPSEFVKPSFAVVSAWLLAQSRTERRAPGYILSTLLVGGVLALLVMQPDLGMSIVVAAGVGRPALRRRPAAVGRGLRRGRAARRRWSAPTSRSPTCAAASTASSIPASGDNYQVNTLARGLHERRAVRPRPGRGHGEGRAARRPCRLRLRRRRRGVRPDRLPADRRRCSPSSCCAALSRAARRRPDLFVTAGGDRARRAVRPAGASSTWPRPCT